MEAKVYQGYTQSELHEAFVAVENKTNWKLPVDAIIPWSGMPSNDMDRLDMVKAAIVFFTGSIARITTLSDDTWHIQAVGYYQTIGA